MSKIKILIIGVNYNSYEELYTYIKSVDNAVDCSKNEVDVDFAVVDNTPNDWENIEVTTHRINLLVFPFHYNLGYLGGATKALMEMGIANVSSYDYTIISNVDIQLSIDFFDKLSTVDDENIGWVVPSIYRDNDNTNENPFMLVRPSKFKLELLKVIYGSTLLYKILYRYSKYKRRIYGSESYLSQRIYAGMGSIFILSKKLVSENYPFSFPAFLYGEELYFAEMVRRSGLYTLFFPELLVYDKSGVSTGKLNLRNKCRMMRAGLSQMIDLYF